MTISIASFVEMSPDDRMTWLQSATNSERADIINRIVAAIAARASQDASSEFRDATTEIFE